MSLSSKNAIFHIILAHLPEPATTISCFFKKFIKTFNFHDAEKQSLKFASTRRRCHQSTEFSILVLDLAFSFTVDSVDFLLNDVAKGLLVDFDLLGVDGVGREKPVDTAARDEQIKLINDLQDYIAQQTNYLTEFDESLVRRWIKQITILDDHITVELKSGVSIDVDA